MDFRNLKIKNLYLKDATVVILFALFTVNCIAEPIIPWWVGLIFFVIYGVLRIWDKDENTIDEFDA